MATRMQQRRGTAAQWISTNNGDGPILETGEIGFETDTGKFKIGDGTNHWVDLDYFLDESEITSITGDYVLANTLGQANGVATLDSSGKLTSTQIPGIDELAQDAVDLALTAGTGITKTYNDNANTITIAVDTSVIATKAELAEVSQDSINDALVAGTGISKSYNDNANTITVSANNVPNSALANSSVTINGFEIALGGSATYSSDNIGEGTTNLYFSNARAQAALASDLSNKQDKVSGVSDTEIGYLDGVTSNVQAQIDAKAPTNSPTFTGTVTLPSGAVTSAMIADETIVNADIANNAAIAQSKIANLTTDLAAKADLSGAAFTGNVSTTANFTVDGNFTVNGSNVLVSATQIQIEDSIIQLAHLNAANTVDLGFVAGYNDGSAKHSGLVKDATDAKWKLFKGVTTEPATTVDFSQATLDDLSVGALEASSLTVGSVSNTEIGYLDGLTSNVQAQLDTKLASSTASSTYAPIASPTFTGTVTLPTGTVTSGMILDGTIVNGDISASAAIDKTKISGNAITAADTATVTNTMLAGSIANNKLANASVTINGESVALGGTVTISAAPTPAAVSSNVTAQANYNYFVDTTAARTITLPASPALGDTIAIWDASGSAATNNITVARNGNKINGQTEDALIDVNQASSFFVYTGATIGWKFD